MYQSQEYHATAVVPAVLLVASVCLQAYTLRKKLRLTCVSDTVTRLASALKGVV